MREVSRLSAGECAENDKRLVKEWKDTDCQSVKAKSSSSVRSQRSCRAEMAGVISLVSPPRTFVKHAACPTKRQGPQLNFITPGTIVSMLYLIETCAVNKTFITSLEYITSCSQNRLDFSSVICFGAMNALPRIKATNESPQ